ncbi:Urease accessory protein UreD [Magnetococcus marinus MC-1]|uniref:Urease accessory protein UreD n=1 Tax=Magnetococcus marinus (strain ATCC BAA-1437 / JCM 17883 / MC-1) TaxID=156889 RepID=URED_MAGMM|nr:urease accessory protein UreD [Magnetococcus marinus]A0L6E9.1 RecName: Full=Urease accessory protein UreD [Magnetococcus marinus MC-1]ABK43542.1 Urease accessory protein UreD [Magnetococcus marinus MC-1]
MRSAATLPYESNPSQGVQGCVRLSFVQRHGQSRLESLYHSDPMRVIIPQTPPGEPVHGVVVTTSGGLVGGDQLDIELIARPHTQLLVMTQAAEKVYRSTGADSTVQIALHVEAGAFLEWLPQETILFDQGRLRRTTQVYLGENARLLAGEMVLFGRSAHGEQLRQGLLRDSWLVHREGALVWADLLKLEGDLQHPLQHPAALAGAKGCATLLLAGEEAAQLLEPLRGWLAEAGMEGPSVKVAAGVVHGLLVVRWLGWDARLLRQGYGQMWSWLRGQLGRPARMPRLWDI